MNKEQLEQLKEMLEDFIWDLSGRDCVTIRNAIEIVEEQLEVVEE